MPRLPKRTGAAKGEDEDEDDVEYKAIGEGEDESSDDDNDGDGDDAMDADDGDAGGAQKPKRPEVWRPTADGVDADVELEYDESAYDCLHAIAH